MNQPRPKSTTLRSERYRRYVAALPCWLCGREGGSQAAHADQGKGGGIKSSDITCFPACGPHSGLPGCHYDIGTSGVFTRAERRAIEEAAGAQTRATLFRQAGMDCKLQALLTDIGACR